jgi:hypothetical protein
VRGNTSFLNLSNLCIGEGTTAARGIWESALSRAAVIPIIASACVMLAGCSGAAGLDARYAREVQMEARSDGKAVVRVVIARRAPDLRAAHEDAPAEYNAWIARRNANAVHHEEREEREGIRGGVPQ